MNDTIGILVVMIAIVCMYLAQSRNTPRGERRTYSILGGLASTMIAVEAASRNEPGVCILFAAAALVSLIIVALAFVKPTNPDA